MKKQIRFTVTAGIIAALYALLTYLSAALGLAYGPVQFRLSEALCVLAAATPAAIPGLTVGCIISNLGSPLGLIDIVCGTAATLIAALAGYIFRKIKLWDFPIIAMLSPVVANALIVGAEIAAFSATEAFASVFWITAAEVAVGELVVCVALGGAVWSLTKKTDIFK